LYHITKKKTAQAKDFLIFPKRQQARRKIVSYFQKENSPDERFSHIS